MVYPITHIYVSYLAQGISLVQNSYRASVIISEREGFSLFFFKSICSGVISKLITLVKEKLMTKKMITQLNSYMFILPLPSFKKDVFDKKMVW